jgi:putative hemolysin
MVTLQDLMEALTGELNPDDGDDLMVVQRDDGSYLLDGLLPIIDLKDCLGLDELPEENQRNYQTLNGLLMLLMGKIPQTADKVLIENWQLEIVDMDGKRVDKVLAIKLSAEQLAELKANEDEMRD